MVKPRAVSRKSRPKPDEYVVDFLPKVKIEAAIDDGLLDQAIEAISKSANTGKVGDGKIFVTALEEAVRIRTGETGPGAV